MKILTQETMQLLKFNWKNFLLFEIIYRILTTPLYFRFINFGLKFCLKRAGYSYLTLGNIGAFLIRPWTLLLILLLGILGIFFLAIEIGSLLTGYTACIYYQKMNPIEMFLGGIEKVIDEVLRKNIKMTAVIIANYILINCYFLYFGLTQIRPVNFLVKNLFELKWVKPLFLVVFLICAVISAVSLFIYHGCMVEQKYFSDGLVRCRQLLSGRYIKSIVLLCLYNAGITAGALLVYFVCLLLATVWIVAFVAPRIELAFLIAFNERMQLWFLFLASIGSTLIYLAGITVQYFQYSNKLQNITRKDLMFSNSSVLAKRNLVRLTIGAAVLSAVCLFDTIYNGNHVGSLMAVDAAITAHRGSSKTAPENTMPALAAAIEELADYAEIDVQETADGVLVLFHDNSLRRTAGINGSVASMNWEQLQTIDVGSWFAPEFEGTMIPRLDQALEYCKGKINLNIEIKNMGNNSRIADRVLDLVEQYDMNNQCVITSVNINYLRDVKQRNSSVKTGYILPAVYGDFLSDATVDFISIRSGFVNERVIEQAHEAGKAIHAWTVNSKSEMERLKLLGVDNVITDYPVTAREIFYGEERTVNLLEYLRIMLR